MYCHVPLRIDVSAFKQESMQSACFPLSHQITVCWVRRTNRGRGCYAICHFLPPRLLMIAPTSPCTVDVSFHCSTSLSPYVSLVICRLRSTISVNNSSTVPTATR